MRIKMREVICAAALGVFAMSSHAMERTRNTRTSTRRPLPARKPSTSARRANETPRPATTRTCASRKRRPIWKGQGRRQGQPQVQGRDGDGKAREDGSQYSVAKEKCDAMSGDAKGKCVQEAKARYHQ